MFNLLDVASSNIRFLLYVTQNLTPSKKTAIECYVNYMLCIRMLLSELFDELLGLPGFVCFVTTEGYHYI